MLTKSQRMTLAKQFKADIKQLKDDVKTAKNELATIKEKEKNV